MPSSDRFIIDKQRNFGDKVGDTFSFLTENFKPLFSVLLYVSGPFLILGSLLSAYSQRYTINITSFSEKEIQQLLEPEFLVSIIIMILTFSLSTLLSYAVVLEYIKYYKENDAIGTIDQIWQQVKKTLFKYFLISLFSFVVFFGLGVAMALVVGLLSEAGNGLVIALFILFYIFFLLYAMYTLFLIYPIVTFEGLGPVQATKKCFKLLKGHNWAHFGLLTVILIISYTISLFFSIPNIGVVSFVTFQEVTGTPYDKPIWFQVVFTATHLISTFGSLLVTVIPLITITLQYFHLCNAGTAKTDQILE